MKRQHQRVLAYAGGALLIIGGGVLAKFLDAGAGAALITGGGFVLGALQKEVLPRPHRRYNDPKGVPVEKEMP